MQGCSIVSTTQKAGVLEINSAKKVADLLDIPYVNREKLSWFNLQKKYSFDVALLIGKNGPMLINKEGLKHEFHISMAQLRILKVFRGDEDHLLKAIGSESVESFLDCTLGLGSDSLLVSVFHPEIKNFIGVEGMKELAYVTNFGMRNFVHENYLVTEALRKIQVRSNDHRTILNSLPDDSIDIVYFDPMFSIPVKKSPQFQMLRGYNWQENIGLNTFLEAQRVAKRKVIIKRRKEKNTFANLPIHYEVGGKYSRITYGVHEK